MLFFPARLCRCKVPAYCGNATASATTQSLQPGTCLLSNDTVPGRMAGSNAKGSAVAWSSGYLILPPARAPAPPPSAAPEVGPRCLAGLKPGIPVGPHAEEPSSLTRQAPLCRT